MKKLSATDGRRGLPDRLAKLFWDYDASLLSWESDRDLVIARVLASGDWAALRWLLDHEGREPLRGWIEARQGRGLDARRLRFWQLVLGVPARRVNQWLRTLARDGWPRRTA